MNTAREQMLQRIREAAIKGNRAGVSSAQIPERGQVGYQGGGADLLVRFREEFTAAGGRLHILADAAAVQVILDLVRSRAIRRVLLGRGDVLDALSLDEPLRAAGVEILKVEAATAENREALFQAELGLSGVDYLIAETGSVVLASRPDQPRSLSLLPPLHIAVAERRQLLPDLFDLFAAPATSAEDLPASFSIITGPSKTGDIELRLVTGVHGPGEVHVIVIDHE
ncbi:MAG TPA: lactate utilization protein [Gemmataceae bacterium]|nr:lactate utilization protein [Gemmataceae bacterium]